jgi:hypothetical protein
MSVRLTQSVCPSASMAKPKNRWTDFNRI